MMMSERSAADVGAADHHRRATVTHAKRTMGHLQHFSCGKNVRTMFCSFGFSAARHPRGIIRPRPKAKNAKNAGCYKTERDRAPNSPWIVTRFSQHGRAIRRAIGLVAPNVIVVLPIRRASCLNSRGERSRH
jgi:hypothetical protein